MKLTVVAIPLLALALHFVAVSVVVLLALRLYMKQKVTRLKQPVASKSSLVKNFKL